MIMPLNQTTDLLELVSFGTELNVAVIGATGGIGAALANDLHKCKAVSYVRSPTSRIGLHPS